MTGPPRPARGWPISQYVFKVHSRCDLACDHCYVYEHVDQSWRARPMAMSADTVRAAAKRISDHAAAHHLSRVSVVLHGGEPLLLGPARLAEILTILREQIEPTSRLDLHMQSNGVRLSETFADILVEFNVKVGISLDGDAAANDRHRLFANGRSSHDDVLAGLQLLRRPEYRRQYAGILCTIDLANEPGAVYEALRAQAPPRLDLLLPHATWQYPPLRHGKPTPYAEWLLAVYSRWTADGRPMPIRVFDSIRSTAAGGPSGNEWLGLDRADLVVLETDGTWEKIDTLKTAYPGAPATGLNVVDHSVDEVAALPEVVRRQIGLDGLAAECRECPVVRQCGGGLYAHRYHPDRGFENRSVYCDDLKELIISINHRLAAEAVAAPVAQTGDSGVPLQVIDLIGAGRTDVRALHFLAETQLSFTRALMVVLGDGGSPVAKAAFGALTELDEKAPDAVAATLAHPYVRAFAIDAAGQLETDGSSADYLACVSVAAALRAGAAVELDVPVRGGALHLPGIGTMVFPDGGSGLVPLEVTPDGCRVRDGRDTRWLGARYISLGAVDLLLEDLDPYRDGHEWRAAERLSAAVADRWQKSLEGVWRILRSDAPDHVGALETGLRTVVPLVVDPAGMMRSSTARQAFGSIAMAIADEESMAVMLVHEWQHNVLGALLDLCDLYDPAHRARIKVPWRDDLRPVEGVLQGTYAHLAIADLWRRRAERDGDGSVAAGRYRQFLSWTVDAVGELQKSGALTALGDRFVAGMAGTIAGWPA